MAALERRYDGIIQRFRVEALGRKLAVCGPIPVAHSGAGFSGDRVRLALDGGAVLRLKLYWPIREVVAALRSIAWRDEVGWAVEVTTAGGAMVVLRAWRASLTA